MANKKPSQLSTITPAAADVTIVEDSSGAVGKKLATKLPSYTVATLPSASTYVGNLIYVSDGTSNKRLAVSDGTNWRFPDGNVVS